MKWRRSSRLTGGSACLRQLLEDCDRELPLVDGITPTVLFSKNENVDDLNDGELAALPGESRTFIAHDDPHVNTEITPKGSPQYEKVMAELRRDKFFTERCQARTGTANALYISPRQSHLHVHAFLCSEFPCRNASSYQKMNT